MNDEKETAATSEQNRIEVELLHLLRNAFPEPMMLGHRENPEAKKMLDEVREMVLSHEWALDLHGFHVDFEAKKMRFDVVKNSDIYPQDGLKILHAEISRAYPDYDIFIFPEVNVSK